MDFAIVPQIFGNWHIKPASNVELKKTDCIVAFSFGGREKNQPGLSNEALARIVIDLHQKFPNHEIMAQWEIADCLPFKLPEHRVVKKHHTEGEYLDTREVAIQMADLRYDPHTKPIVVAHPLHIWRCLKSLERVGFRPVPADTTSVPCDPFSTQSWTRSNTRFIIRELPGRLLYLLKGFI